MTIWLVYNILIFIINSLLQLNIFKQFSSFRQQQLLFKEAMVNYTPKANSFWFVVSSAGEFEQALPLIKIIKQEKKDSHIVVSFFSKSGFDLFTKHNLVDFSFYFPLDTKHNAQLMVEKIKAQAVFFIRYEIWLNTLVALKAKQTPTFLINQEDKKRSFIYQKYLYYSYTYFTKIFNVNQFGDTKIEQAIAHKIDNFEDKQLETFCSNNLVILLASCYLEEVRIVAHWYCSLNNKENIKIIVCPHEPTEDFYRTCNVLFEDKFFRYSESDRIWKNLLYIDKKGVLKYLYRYATISFIGGGFNNKLHNIFEALIYDTVVCCGNNISKFAMEENLAKEQIIFLISNEDDWCQLIDTISNDKKSQVKTLEMANKNKFLEQHLNTSQRIWNTIVSLVQI
ncbi:MAG: hypothetical protein H6553_13965 [Chitinophagales bacterium]|nr:hypothetical protein [Chitinophagales bacterium]